MNPKTTITLTIIATLIILSAGCIESSESVRHRPSIPNTEHVSGIDQYVTIECTTLHVSGVDNTVIVTNNNIKRIYVSGVDNIVYIPSSSSPITSVSGIRCNIIRR